MRNITRNLFVLLVLLAFELPLAWAQDISDEATDVEEIRSETDAMKGVLKETNSKLKVKRAENETKFGKVRKARDAAIAKRDKLAEELKKSEDELNHLASEGTSLETEIQRLKDETEILQKDVAEQKSKVAKSKEANATQKADREAKQKKIKELHKEQMQLVRESAAAQDRVNLIEAQTKEQIEREDLAIRELEAAKAEVVAEKVLLDRRVASVQEQLSKLRARKTTVQKEINNARARSYKLKEEVRTGESQLRRAKEDLENQVMYDENSN